MVVRAEEAAAVAAHEAWVAGCLGHLEVLPPEALQGPAGGGSGGEGGHQWLDALCVWPRANVAERLNEALQSNSDRERASLIFTLRAGARNVSGWSGWRNWLMQSGWTLEREQKYLAQLVQQRPVELLALWCRQNANADSDAVAVLEDWCQATDPAVDADAAKG